MALHNAITIPSNQLIILCTLIDEMYRFSVNNSIIVTPEPHDTVFITSYVSNSDVTMRYMLMYLHDLHHTGRHNIAILELKTQITF